SIDVGYHRLIPELLLELLIRQRPFQIPQRTLHKTVEHGSVLQLDLNIRLVFGDRRVGDGRNAIAHSLEEGINHRGIRKFLQTTLAANQSDSGGVVDGILAVEALPEIALIAQIQNQRRHAYPHSLDRIDGWMVIAVDVDATINRRLHNDAARIRFV